MAAKVDTPSMDTMNAITTQSLPFWMTYPTRDGFTAYCEKEAERMCKSKEAGQVNGAYFVGAITDKKKGAR